MTDNYDEIIKATNKMFKSIYKDMNDYLENIINSPSTINRIFRYYAIGLPSDSSIHERYIMFGGTVVRKYIIEEPKTDIYFQKELRRIKHGNNQGKR